MKYVALLRGINVGGKNKVDMKQLVAAMTAKGFEDVSTYINSGNIFLASDDTPQGIIKKLQRIIKTEFGIDINVLLRDQKSIEQVVKSIPSNWRNGSEMKCDVMFLWEKYDNKNVLSELTIKPKIDTVRYVDGAIIWKVDRENVTKSGMLKLVGTDVYKNMTIRNCNTVRKIWERMNVEND